jgi:hypothetical protein
VSDIGFGHLLFPTSYAARNRPVPYASKKPAALNGYVFTLTSAMLPNVEVLPMPAGAKEISLSLRKPLR